MYDAVTPMNTEEIFHEFRNSVISKDFLNAVCLTIFYSIILDECICICLNLFD